MSDELGIIEFIRESKLDQSAQLELVMAAGVYGITKIKMFGNYTQDQLAEKGVSKDTIGYLSTVLKADYGIAFKETPEELPKETKKTKRKPSGAAPDYLNLGDRKL
jgi:hypothetical protein